MLPKLSYRLAIDLGTASIGWCMLKIDSNRQPQAIIKMGVRIFSDGRNPKDGSSLAVKRRQARQMRRKRDRFIRRKSKLIDALVKYKFFSDNPIVRKSSITLDPYELRKKGLTEELAPHEFGRAIFHLNQRRGFLSNRKTNTLDGASSLLKQAIVNLHEKLDREDCKTLGEWLAKRKSQGLGVRSRLFGKKAKDKAYEFYVDRSMVEHEFNALWNVQKSFNPGLFNEGAYSELRNLILFQRDLNSVRPGRCTLLPEEERAPIALPTTQLFRIYQEVNNLKILSVDLKEIGLTKSQRDHIVSLLVSKNKVSFKVIAKALGLPKDSTFNLQDGKREFLKGNITEALLSKDEYFGSAWQIFSLTEQDHIVSRLLNEPNEELLTEWLVDSCNLEIDAANRVANSLLPDGYGSLSKVALDKILPALMNEVISYDKAVVAANFDSHSALSHPYLTGEIMSSLPYYGDPLRRHVAFSKENPKNDEERFGKIANPTVHIGLNELRKVVNALINRYGHPSEVVIEVTRDLKVGRKKRKEIQQAQKIKQDLNERLVNEACEVLGLSMAGLDRNKRKEISQKMQLWYELCPSDISLRCCPYTGEYLSLPRLLSSEVEIDHILPYSRTLDDSLNNKTVCLSRANRFKGNRTPSEAFGRNSHNDYSYEDILRRAANMAKSKAIKFSIDGYERWLKNDKDFIARALNDTAYLSKIATEYLSVICPPNHVWAIPGRMTAILRGMYGLNYFLSHDGLKNRSDHRHHALDAAVIGIVDKALLRRFSNASSRSEDLQLGRLLESVPLPWPTYKEQVKAALKSVIVSHKPDHGYQGAMHEETAWGLRENGIVTRRVFDEESGTFRREFAKKNLIEVYGKSSLERHRLNDDGSPAPYKGYISGSNYCIEIWEDQKGRWQGDVISTYAAYQVIRNLGEMAGWKRLRDSQLTLSNKPLVMRLAINDCLKLNINGFFKIMRVVKIGSNGQISFAEHNEANVDARNRDPADPFAYISRGPNSLKSSIEKKITISPIGVVSYRIL